MHGVDAKQTWFEGQSTESPPGQARALSQLSTTQSQSLPQNQLVASFARDSDGGGAGPLVIVPGAACEGPGGVPTSSGLSERDDGVVQPCPGRRQPSGQGALVLPSRNSVRKAASPLDGAARLLPLLQYLHQQLRPGVLLHPPGAGRTHARQHRPAGASNTATRYLHHQLCPGVLLHPPGLQLLYFEGGCGRTQEPALLVHRTHARQTSH